MRRFPRSWWPDWLDNRYYTIKRFISCLSPLALVIAMMLYPGCSKLFDDGINDEPRPLKAVDLGLPSGNLWASQNLLADRPWALGGSFAWGETHEIDDSCDYSFIVDGRLTAYNFEEERGVVDNRYILDPEDDAASALLGEEWRIPTKWDFDELKENCEWKACSIKGICGYKFTSKENGNSIFIPSYKRGWFLAPPEEEYYYWTSCVSEYDCLDPIDYARCVGGDDFHERRRSRERGLYIRPVMSGRAPVESITMKTADLSMTPGDNCRLGVVFSPRNALDRRISWSSGDEIVAFIDKDGKLTALFPGNTSVTALSISSGVSTKTDVAVADFIVPELVDLGLPSGTLWADRDIGALDVTDQGLCFAFGEVHPKMTFSPDNYYGGKDYTPHSYLQQEHDAATTIFGVGWKMPTPEMFAELVQYCDISSTEDFTSRFKLVSKNNGNTLYLPEQIYWTSLFEDYHGTPMGFGLCFYMYFAWQTGQLTTKTETKYCYNGLLVRPVFTPEGATH